MPGSCSRPGGCHVGEGYAPDATLRPDKAKETLPQLRLWVKPRAEVQQRHVTKYGELFTTETAPRIQHCLPRCCVTHMLLYSLRVILKSGLYPNIAPKTSSGATPRTQQLKRFAPNAFLYFLLASVRQARTIRHWRLCPRLLTAQSWNGPAWARVNRRLSKL